MIIQENLYKNTQANLFVVKINRKLLKILLQLAIGLFSTALLAYLMLSLYFSNHFYNNTVVNGVNVSNMTVAQAENAINRQVYTYILHIEGRNDLSDQIVGANIGLHTVFEKNVEKILKQQGGFGWPTSLTQSQNLNVKTMLACDDTLLKKYVEELPFLDGANIIAPTDAYISEYSENGYQLVPETPGTRINKDKLYDTVKSSVLSMKDTVSLENTDCYVENKANEDYPKMVKAVDKLNKISGAKITYEFGDTTEVIDGKMISKWLSVDDKYKVKFDKDEVKKFVDYIEDTYNTFGSTRKFKTTYGKKVEISGGDYGWWLNKPAETEALIKLIKDGKEKVRKPAYYQEAQQYGKNDIGDTYVEINLAKQHLYLYKDGDLCLDTPIVSGNVSKGNSTPIGTYSVKYKEADATLNGRDYSTPVKYWMPFNCNIGLHDANWRSQFGGSIYLSNGSHGCINIPPKKAKKIFKKIEKGTPVVVYSLKDTD